MFTLLSAYLCAYHQNTRNVSLLISSFSKKLSPAKAKVDLTLKLKSEMCGVIEFERVCSSRGILCTTSICRAVLLR